MLKNLNGISDNHLVLTSEGWEYLANITLSTQICAIHYVGNKRVIEYKTLKSLSKFSFTGMITKYTLESVSSLKTGECSKLRFYLKTPKNQDFPTLLGSHKILSQKLVPCKGDLVYLYFNHPASIVISEGNDYFFLSV